jgi:hypothetical protein
LGPSDEDILHSAAVKVSKSHVAHAEFLLITVDEIISHLQENALTGNSTESSSSENQPVVGGKTWVQSGCFSFLQILFREGICGLRPPNPHFFDVQASTNCF